MPTLRHRQTTAIDDGLTPIRLTRREIEVLTLITQGKPSLQVAEQLFISRRTVDFHLANIYQKLEVSNRAQAFYEATRRGLLALPCASVSIRAH